ncbi:MAG: FUSC family protein [Bilophila sp.]
MQKETVSKIQIAAVTGLSLVCVYALAFIWHIDKPFWAGFTVFMLSLPSIGQSLQKGLLRIVGTFIGAATGLFLFILFSQERFLLLFALSIYLSVMMYFMSGSRFYGYFFFITAIVTMIIVLVGSKNPADVFTLAVYRSEETLLGIAVYTLITLVVAPQLSLKTFTVNIEKILQAHLTLFVQAQEQEKEGSLRDMYVKYNEIHTLMNATQLLLPAVKLENSQIYADRALWRSALACSTELFETQRKWTGTLVAMKNLDLEALFSDFTPSMAALQQLFSCLVQPSSPPLQAQLVLASETTATRSAMERGLLSTAQTLYQRQVQLCNTLQKLIDYLLHQGKKPVSIESAPEQRMFFFRPEQRSSLIQTFVLFWITVCIWILLDPPGTENMAFLELTLVLGLFILLTGSEPLHSVLYFVYGIGLTGVLYFFVYPFVTNFTLFLALLFVIAFILSFWFSHPTQKSMKFGFMMPWLSVCNFTNIPQYSFYAFTSRSSALLLGMCLVACIHYLFFAKDANSAFIQKQLFFFHAAQRLVVRMQSAHTGKKQLYSTLYSTYTLHKLHFLAAQIGLMAQKVSRPFMAPAIAQILGTELMDIATSLYRLQTAMATSDQDVSLHLAPLSKIKKPSFAANSLLDHVKSLHDAVEALLVALYADSQVRVQTDSTQSQRIAAICGSILRSLSCYVCVVQSLQEPHERVKNKDTPYAT